MFQRPLYTFHTVINAALRKLNIQDSNEEHLEMKETDILANTARNEFTCFLNIIN